MTTVVADAGPPHYLALIEAAHLLPGLFGTVIIPDAVHAELSRPRTPEAVRNWIASAPGWLQIETAPAPNDPDLAKLDVGERAAIALARQIDAELILMDDRMGVAVARRSGLQTTGTLGVLLRGAARGMVDLTETVARLKTTNFRYPSGRLDALVAHYRQG